MTPTGTSYIAHSVPRARKVPARCQNTDLHLALNYGLLWSTFSYLKSHSQKIVGSHLRPYCPWMKNMLFRPFAVLLLYLAAFDHGILGQFDHLKPSEPQKIILNSRLVSPGSGFSRSIRRRALSPTTYHLLDDFKGTDLQ